MDNIKKREIVVGAIFLLIGIGYLYLTSAIPRKQFIDAAFVPYVLATTMCLLGVLQLREAFKRAGAKQSGKQDTADYRTVWKTLGLIVAYAALLESVGFPLMTVVYLFAQFIVLTPGDKKISYPLYGAIAVTTSIVVYLTFRHAFDMILPVGLLSAFIE
ncbi:tripartite tricarboxylate transporter TctB family protein [Rhodoferax sp. U11-2br]|uniref:tripartite tricarboxylate transporter TctB family protein n=1 Tax=Rhodoferax sp. U11-2br TaxID=2838878 RepID=UPI001BE8B13F|nr:tripartite tricarboxylate transporter TctB family protein [Rhodoferax sp. U11-2br]MBT3068184.1 tripartite tricarboxylate transporter TctB family protein [Rhodoferax sp. U11-2br]